MVEVKTPGEIDAMRAAGRVVAQALAAVQAHVAVGIRRPTSIGWRARARSS